MSWFPLNEPNLFCIIFVQYELNTACPRSETLRSFWNLNDIFSHTAPRALSQTFVHDSLPLNVLHCVSYRRDSSRRLVICLARFIYFNHSN